MYNLPTHCLRGRRWLIELSQNKIDDLAYGMSVRSEIQRHILGSNSSKEKNISLVTLKLWSMHVLEQSLVFCVTYCLREPIIISTQSKVNRVGGLLQLVPVWDRILLLCRVLPLP